MKRAKATIRIPADVHARLIQLAHSSGRSLSDLATEAIDEYVDRELSILAGIDRGLADYAAGRTVPHDEAMDLLDAAIERASAERRGLPN